MGRIVERSRKLLGEPGGWGRFGFYTTGQLLLEEYYTLAVIGKAGLGTPHMDGNTRLCTATAGAALKASFGTDGQPGSYTDIDHCDAIALWGHNVAETQAMLWTRMLDRRRGAGPAARCCASTRGPRRSRGGRRAPRPAQRDEPRAHERAAARGHRPRLDRRGLGRRAHARLRRAEGDRRRDYTPRRVAEICDVDARAARRGGRARRHVRAPAVDRPAGLLSVQPGHGRRLPGQQPAPAARHDRPARRRRAADERPAERAEHARDRRRRRPARLSQLGQRGARPRARRAVERRPGHDPALGAADARDADLALRRAGLDRAAVDQRDEPGGLAARAAPHPLDPRARGALRRRAGPVSHRDGRASPTSCCPARAGARRPAR